MTNEFLPKDPAAALVEVKERLYARLRDIESARDSQSHPQILMRRHAVVEWEWLRELINDMEKSL